MLQAILLANFQQLQGFHRLWPKKQNQVTALFFLERPVETL